MFARHLGRVPEPVAVRLAAPPPQHLTAPGAVHAPLLVTARPAAHARCGRERPAPDPAGARRAAHAFRREAADACRARRRRPGGRQLPRPKPRSPGAPPTPVGRPCRDAAAGAGARPCGRAAHPGRPGDPDGLDAEHPERERRREARKRQGPRLWAPEAGEGGQELATDAARSSRRRHRSRPHPRRWHRSSSLQRSSS